MRFGVFDQLEHPGGVALGDLYRWRIDLAVRAEQAGFWGYHKSEHHMIPLDAAPGINVFLAALSQRTSRIRLCSLVHLLPFYHPMRLVEELAMLDQLSNGRLEIGFGKGVSAPEHLHWGLDFDVADRHLDETLQFVLHAFQSDASVTFEGEFFSCEDTPLLVHPVQKPYPPLWRPGTLATAAQLGVSTITGGPTELVASQVDAYHAAYKPGLGGGHTPTIGAVRRIYVAPTDAEAIDRARASYRAYTDHVLTLFRRYNIAAPGDPTLGGDFDLARKVNGVVAGSPSTIRAHLEEFAAVAKTDYFVTWPAWGDLSRDEVFRSFDLFATVATDFM